MASALVNVALSSIRPPHASYYGEINDNNPVVHAANKEIDEVITYFSKKSLHSDNIKHDEACSRGSNWLFDIWNKYEPRLPLELFYEKLIKVGDRLKELGVYNVANRQCYMRYLLMRYGQVPLPNEENAQSYREVFFHEKQSASDNILTSKALVGMYMCEFNSILERDPILADAESSSQCQTILKGLRVFMQCLMIHESLCWMVYNCTILIYQICRVLMTTGDSMKAIEFLLWASMCMETVIPLVGVKYLGWRVTLYTAVCLAYYDCRVGHHAESFARRGLSKLQELSDLERLSNSSQSPQTRLIFRQATAKMASMVFKRTVYETRRKPKGYLRPKMRSNLKDAAQLSWPRTATERLVSDMFEGGAAQFMAILEALSSSNRRTLFNPPTPPIEPEFVEVTSELFFAGKEIIAGGGGVRNAVASGADHSVLAGVQHEKSLIELASTGEDGVTLSSVVRFIKLAFSYEQWSVFDTLLDCTLIYIKKSGDGTVKDGTTEHSGTELCLALLLVMERVSRSKSNKKSQMGTSGSFLPSVADESNEGTQQNPQASPQSVHINDDLINLAETVLYCINEPSLFTPQGLDGDVLIDRDMIVDATLLLWNRCKKLFGKIQSGSRRDMAFALQRTGNPGKWVHILTVVHSALIWSGVGAVDPVLIAEVCLRLAISLEAAASADSYGVRRFSEDNGANSRMSVYSTTQLSPNNQLVTALQTLNDGLKAMSIGRAHMTSNDGRNVADISWMNRTEENSVNISTSEALLRDLHVEMLVVHHRIALRLSEQSVDTKASKYTNRRTPSRNSIHSRNKDSVVLTEEKILEMVGGSLLSRAILYMQQADELQPGEKAVKLLKKAVNMIETAQKEEKRLFEDSWVRLNNSYSLNEVTDVPSPPILLSRSDSSMTFKPAPFKPDSVKVAWYRIFGRLAAGPNVKVRLNDYYLPGTGDEVPAGKECFFRVSGLQSKQRYVFAVAAYTADGKLIGGSVGKTGHSIVACHPLSVLSTWGHLAQVSHKLGSLEVSKRACSVLWDHFITMPSEPPQKTWTSSSRQDFTLSVYHLNHDVARESSPVLLRHALTSVFVAIDTEVSDASLYCDKTSEKGPLLSSQITRLHECERMLVAMEIAGWLNEPSSLLQAVVQTYGLLAPIIQAEVSALPVVQVATRCHSALQEIKKLLKLKRSKATTECLNHMTAVLSNYIGVFAKSHGKPQLALSAIEAGRYLLRGDPPPPPPGGRKTQADHHGPGSKRHKRKQAANDAQLDKLTVSMSELAALEERLAEITKDNRSSDELMGTEDGNQVLARLSKMRSITAFRELVKFRRRSKFLEFFVFALRRALKAEHIDLAIEHSQDTLAHIHRRNETLAVNRAVVSKQPGGVAVQGDETRKFAAAIAEYSHDPKKTKKDEAIKAKQREKQKKFTMMKRKSGANVHSDEQEEAERRALYILSIHLLKSYRNYVKRKKLRKILGDEIVWFSEFNHLNGRLHSHSFFSKVKERLQIRGVRTPLYETQDYLDQDLWSYSNSGSIVVGWDNSPKVSDDDDDLEEDQRRALEKAAFLTISTALVCEPKPSTPPTDMDKDSPRTQRVLSALSTVTPPRTYDPELLASLQPDILIQSLKLSMLCYRRAMVLAHRGKQWTLLQNAARSLDSTVMAALQISWDSSEPAYTLKELRDVVRLPVVMAADLLMDMLVQMQDGNSEEKLLAKGYFGEPKDEKGALSLSFEEPVDDSSFVNALLMKRMILNAIQLLHIEKRYEKLVDICLRFSSLSRDRVYDVVTPLLVHAQAKIKERVQSFNGEDHPQAHFLQAAIQLGKGHVENKDYTKYKLKVTPCENSSNVDVGGFIDPASHDVYGGGKRAMALSCVPFDPDHSMEKLRVNFSQSQYTSRALQHSRRLLLIYLASQHNHPAKSRKPSAKIGSASSGVEFSMKAGEQHSSAPPDVTNMDFTSTDVLEKLASSQLSTIVQSYNRTIELLMSHGERDLVSQAANELADLYMHQGNMKAAHKWWKYALDKILKTKDSINQWRKVIKDRDNIPRELLDICGIWGCLLAISLACKIGEFTASDVGMKTECALLAAALVRAIFKSSLPHPTADVDYADYEIIPTSAQIPVQIQGKSKASSPVMSGRVQANSLLNGIDIFADRFRCDLQTMIGSLHWLCDFLVSMKFCLPALPALTLYQYLATFVCRDKQKSVQCRCLKLTALIELRMFNEATNDALNLLFGGRLPHPCDVSYIPPDCMLPPVFFNVQKPIDDVENLKAMEVIATKRLSGALATLYGPHLTCEVALCQAHLLTAFAECISCIPQKPTSQDLQFVTPDIQPDRIRKPSSPQLGTPRSRRRASSFTPDDAKSNVSAFSAAGSRSVYKLFTKRDRPVGLQLLKGMLLVVSESLATTMTKAFQFSKDSLTPSEVWLLVNSFCLLSKIQQQRQLSTLSASRALNALNVIKFAKVFEDQFEETSKPRKSRSALRMKNSLNSESELDTNNKKKIEPYPVMEQLYRTRLNARLWLDCRLRLCQALSSQVKGLGKIGKASDKAGLLDHSQAQLYCAEGLAEAEACNDVEMQALFLIQGASLDGISSNECKHMLEDATASLDEQPELSSRAVLKLVESTTMMSDVSLLSGYIATQESIDLYRSAHSVLLLKAMQEGETIVHSQSGAELSCLDDSPNNLYSPNLQLLAQLKLRIAHSIFQTLPSNSVTSDHSSLSQLLSQAMHLSDESVFFEPQLLAEIHIELGKIQRLLMSVGAENPRSASANFAEAVKLAEAESSDLSTIRQAYLEMAMLNIAYLEGNKSITTIMSTEPDRASSSPSLAAAASIPETGVRSFSLDVGIVSEPLELSQTRSRVASSLFAAYHAARGIQQRAVLPGSPQVTSLTFSLEDKAALPDFVVVDLSSEHTGFPTVTPSDDITIDPVLAAVRTSSSGITWIHVLTYNVLLQRKSRLSTLVANDNVADMHERMEFTGEEEMLLQNQPTTVRTPLNSSDNQLRLTALHEYLTRHSSYANTYQHSPSPSGKSFVAAQWYRAGSSSKVVQLLWCTYRADGPVNCDCLSVNADQLENISQQAAALKKRTDESIGRNQHQSESGPPTHRKKAKAKVPAITNQLEEDWKHVINQIINLLSTQDEPITQLPFKISLTTSQSLVDLFTVGCCFETAHPLHKWMMNLLCPC